MKKILAVMMVAVAAMTMGCAASQQCVRDVQDLQAESLRQNQEIRDLQAKLMVVNGEHAGGDLASLASDAWDTAKAAFGWAKSEYPDAAQKVSTVYHESNDRLDRAHQCYNDHGGQSAHTFEEYRVIAMACIFANTN